MKTGDIVFAPFRDTMWPGRIQKIDQLAHVKFYKIKEQLKIPQDSLIQFTHLNISLFLTKNKSKTFTAAIKIAENQLKKQQQRESQDSRNDRSKSSKGKGKGKGKRGQRKVIPNLKKDCKMEDFGEKESEESINEKDIKNEEDCKAEENQKSKGQEDKEVPQFNNIIQFLLSLSNQQLLKLATKSTLHQFVFFLSGTQEKRKIMSSPKLELQKLAEWMLSRLILLKTTQKIQFYQQKLITIFSNCSISLASWMTRDVTKLLALIIDRHDRSLLAWKNPKFIQGLLSFQQKLRKNINLHIQKLNQVSVVVDLIRQFQLKQTK